MRFLPGILMLILVGCGNSEIKNDFILIDEQLEVLMQYELDVFEHLYDHRQVKIVKSDERTCYNEFIDLKSNLFITFENNTISDQLIPEVEKGQLERYVLGWKESREIVAWFRPSKGVEFDLLNFILSENGQRILLRHDVTPSIPLTRDVNIVLGTIQ